MRRPLSTITLPIELTNGNQGRGFHWAKAAKRRKDYENIMRLLGYECREPLDFPVDLHITRLMTKRQRPWDADSIGRGSVKELIDSCVACHWFVDDGPKWIRSVRYSQRRSNDGKTGVEIQIFKAE